ncbi:TPA: hypothetical protein ACHWKL_002954 [Providencia stuartii]|uniref:hypothetical protein n=1 Tax=Providencia stuartii TaxID=588 RepID=UPI00114085CB|nr:MULTISPECIES: hypothetical protein [Providencia]MBN5562956.1 hypothetical protein [Providencia stuartii]MBN5602958.1 hypothetical protein [Providencia stuartii]MBN5606980.1 hypothetical protein [Providencia stuartii]MDN0012395.1 hypothetical protein [Providencia stuartii]TPW66299.1 hypothetical protein DL505_21225 [Providencia stuartii]
MLKKQELFLTEKIDEIKISLQSQEPDMYVLIGSVRDLFSSIYNTNIIASNKIILDLWDALLKVFLESKYYDNRFDAIFVMSDINLYAKKQNIDLNMGLLKAWINKNESSNETEEILECVDDILT